MRHAPERQKRADLAGCLALSPTRRFTPHSPTAIELFSVWCPASRLAVIPAAGLSVILLDLDRLAAHLLGPTDWEGLRGIVRGSASDRDRRDR